MTAVKLGPIGTRRKPSQKKNPVHLGIYLPPNTIERLDAWRNRQYATPSRMAVIRQILLNWLDKQEKSK